MKNRTTVVMPRKAEAARKLEALREAVRVGTEALDHGEYKHFESFEDLEAYLNDLAEKVISRAAGRAGRFPCRNTWER
jgi:antitoxin ParD1/3/4